MLFRFIVVIVLFGYIIGVDLQQQGIDLKELRLALSEIDFSERNEKNLEQREIEKDPQKGIFLYSFTLSLINGLTFLLLAAIYFGLFISEIFFIPLGGGLGSILLLLVLLNAITFGFLFKSLFAGFILFLEKIKILKL